MKLAARRALPSCPECGEPVSTMERQANTVLSVVDTASVDQFRDPSMVAPAVVEVDATYRACPCGHELTSEQYRELAWKAVGMA